MPDPHRMKNEFQALLSRPELSSLFTRRNQFRKPSSPPESPASVAAQAADYLWKNSLLVDPVEIVEVRGPVELYRGHDGGSGYKTAGTLGRSWVDRALVQELWKATSKYAGEQRLLEYMEFLRTYNFVLPEWNGMSSIACMSVPAGSSMVVARGRGSWKAMRTPVGGARPGRAAAIRSQADVMDQLGMMPIPGGMQYFVPLFNDMWVRPVNYPSAGWPCLT